MSVVKGSPSGQVEGEKERVRHIVHISRHEFMIRVELAVSENAYIPGAAQEEQCGMASCSQGVFPAALANVSSAWKPLTSSQGAPRRRSPKKKTNADVDFAVVDLL